MFIKMATEPIPIRVFALYNLVADKKAIEKSKLRKLMEPEELDQDKTSYFSQVLSTALELGIVVEHDGSMIEPSVDKKILKSIGDFRFYSASQLEKFADGDFYRVTGTILNCNEEIFTWGSISDSPFRAQLKERLGLNLDDKAMRGWRFWAQFLGFGYMNGMYFSPNAYVFVRDTLSKCNLKKNMSIPFPAFLAEIGVFYKELIKVSPEKHYLNIAFSSALRQLHENGEIELQYNKDRQDSMLLYPLQGAGYFHEPVTNIIYKGVKL